MTKKTGKQHPSQRRSSRPTRGKIVRAKAVAAPIPVTEWEKGENRKPAPRDDSPTG